MVNISSSSTKLSFYIPEFYWWFQDNICNIARSYFSRGLVFNMYEKSIVLNVDNSISRSPFKSHLPGCLFWKYAQSPIGKAGLSFAIFFWVALNLFSSNVFFAIAHANLCVSRFSMVL